MLICHETFYKLLLTKKRGSTEIKQKHLFWVSEFQFGDQRKLCPPSEQKSGELKDKRECLHMLTNNLIGTSGRKLILAKYDWMLRLTLSKSPLL